MTVKALGRGLAELGLDAILNETDVAQSLCQIPVGQIDPDPQQPRQHITEENLQELAQSIQAHGIIQPVLVLPRGDRFQLIAGERRWRAAQIAGLNSIPAVIGDFSHQQRQAVALVENIQREDLSSIEQARGIDRLMIEHKLTHQELADTLGFSRSQVSNLLRLLQLSPCSQQALLERTIHMGHARCLIGLSKDQQKQVIEKIHAEEWSVRRTEQAVNRLHQPVRQLMNKPVRMDTSLSKKGCQFKIQKTMKKTTLEVSVKDEHLWHELLQCMEQWCDQK